MGLTLSQLEDITEAKSIKCGSVKKTFVINDEIIQIKEEINKLIKLKKNYLTLFNKLLEKIIADKKYINELISYLENVKINCLPKYNKYENNILEKYVITSVSPIKRKLNKEKNSDLLTINFTKICKIILVKLNVSKVKIQNSINEYKKILSYISKSSKKNVKNKI